LTATTINNYAAGFAMDSATSLTQTSMRKTNTRYVAENSIHVLELLTQKEATVLPSHLLGDAQWLDYTNRLFGVENLVADISVNDEMKERGDM
jgi:hypothetical protein